MPSFAACSGAVKCTAVVLWTRPLAAGGWLLGGQVAAVSALLAQCFLPAVLLFAVAMLLMKVVKSLRRRAAAA